MESTPPPLSQPPPQPGGYIPGQKPGVLIWYRVYLILMCLMFLVVAGLGGALFSELFPVTEEDLDGTPPKAIGAIYFVMGIIMLIPFAVALFIPRKSWAWIYHLVMICIGLTGCTIVGSIPLLIFWIKPETKEYFKRGI